MNTHLQVKYKLPKGVAMGQTGLICVSFCPLLPPAHEAGLAHGESLLEYCNISTVEYSPTFSVLYLPL